MQLPGQLWSAKSYPTVYGCKPIVWKIPLFFLVYMTVCWHYWYSIGLVIHSLRVQFLPLQTTDLCMPLSVWHQAVFNNLIQDKGQILWRSVDALPIHYLIFYVTLNKHGCVCESVCLIQFHTKMLIYTSQCQEWTLKQTKHQNRSNYKPGCCYFSDIKKSTSVEDAKGSKELISTALIKHFKVLQKR